MELVVDGPQVVLVVVIVLDSVAKLVVVVVVADCSSIAFSASGKSLAKYRTFKYVVQFREDSLNSE